MSGMKLVRSSAITMAMLGLLCPQFALASGAGDANRPSFQLTPRDVKLGEGGALNGQVVDRQGMPVVGTRIVVGQSGKTVADAQTDRNGYFRIAGLRSGVYSVATTRSVAVYRVWQSNVAPPAATSSALLVNGEEVIRSQQGGSIVAWLANPLVLGGLTVTAIAIPLALDDDDDEASGS